MSASQTRPARNARTSPDAPQPWWRHGMVWLVVAGPAIVVVAAIYTAVLAIRHPDPVLETQAVTPTSSPKVGEMPAMQGRNHAVTPAAQ
ncbi:MAG: hypothetical protein RJA98_373 [Pseudomonadota bacterium]|jgi:hypothetical protein